jgi:uncharacterized membrane protein
VTEPPAKTPDTPPNPAAPSAGAVPPAPGVVFNIPVGPGLPFPYPGAAPLGIAALVQQIQMWQGPYPPPDAVRQYEEILPGAFDRMIAMAEQAQAAQIEANNHAQNYLRDDTKRGHWLGFAATCTAMIGAVVCAWIGQSWVAALFLGVPVMAVAKALVDGARAQKTQVVAAPPAPPSAPGPAPEPPK